MDLIQRPRRLRGSETLRKMVRETRIDKSSLEPLRRLGYDLSQAKLERTSTSTD